MLYRTSPIGLVWYEMIKRCYNPRQTFYRHYGGRGITVCDRWRFGHGERDGLACFLADMSPLPSPKHQLDRIDNNGNYDLSNCRWVTKTEQVRNRRITKFVLCNGERIPLAEACERAGIKYYTALRRTQKGFEWWDGGRKRTPQQTKFGEGLPALEGSGLPSGEDNNVRLVIAARHVEEHERRALWPVTNPMSGVTK